MIKAVRAVRSKGLSNDGIQGRLKSRRQVRFKTIFLANRNVITHLFFRYASTASANTRSSASSIWVLVFSIGPEIACHFFNCYGNVLYMRIRLTNLFTICVFNDVRTFCFTYGLDLRGQYVRVDGESYSAGPVRGVFPRFKGAITGKDGNTRAYCCGSFWFRIVGR